jgi:hypothetical protein
VVNDGGVFVQSVGEMFEENRTPREVCDGDNRQLRKRKPRQNICVYVFQSIHNF